MAGRRRRRSATAGPPRRCSSAPLLFAIVALIGVSACSVAEPTLAGPTRAASPSAVASAPATLSPPASSEATPPPVGSDAGRRWAALPGQPTLEGAYIGSLSAGGPGELLAGGYVGTGVEGQVDGAIWASQDGRTWGRLTVRSGFEDAAVGTIARAADGSYLAVGTTCHFECEGVRLWRSADGVQWAPVEHDLPFTAATSVIAGSRGWIVIGELNAPFGNLAAWTSADGASWTRAAGIEEAPGFMRDLVTTDAGYVAAGSMYPEERSEPGVWTSVDGTVWQRVPAELAPGGLGIDALARIGGLLVVFARTEEGLEIWTSEDGQAWTHRPGSGDAIAIDGARGVRMGTVVPGGPGLVAFGSLADPALGSGPGAWVSGDGIAWSAAEDASPLAEAVVYDAIAFGDEVLAVGRLPCDIETCVERPAFWISPPR